MLDKSIPYKNLLMKCMKINENALTSLPDGVHSKCIGMGMKVFGLILNYYW
ncbi:MAG: hypothetical protein WCD89_15410 [Anaerocolumna sp.]